MIADLLVGLGLVHDAAAGTWVAAAVATYPALTVLLAVRHLDEHVDRTALAGALTAVVGIALLPSW
jgi:drug/metabolite transporter (DMT)-like permease